MHSTGSRAILVALAVAVTATVPAGAQSMSNDKAMADKNMASDKMMMSPKGMFTGAMHHSASGSYTVSGTGKDRKLELGSDFKVDKAPDVYVVLAKGMDKNQGSLELGKLKRNEGSQSFKIPESANLDSYTDVLLWSKKDNVVIGEASLGKHGSMGSMDHGSMDHGSMDKGAMMDKPAMAKDTGMMKKP